LFPDFLASAFETAKQIRQRSTRRSMPSKSVFLWNNYQHALPTISTSLFSSESSFNEVAHMNTDKKFLQRHKYWIILVDDEDSIRQSVGDFLYDSGYQVTACADAAAAMEVCQNEYNNLPDVIVSDVRMPGTDGIALLKQIRKDKRLQRVPVILLTAKGLTADRIEGYKAGADAYLSKPFNPVELLSIVDCAILRRRQMVGTKVGLAELKQEIAAIKHIMKQNGANVVKKTDVYLTPVEREVLTLVCKGYTNNEIAAERGVNVVGVSLHLTKLYIKSETKTRTELVRWAFQTGYVSKQK
jgi:DNA-binding NarL/FixJ family response regulator